MTPFEKNQHSRHGAGSAFKYQDSATGPTAESLSSMLSPTANSGDQDPSDRRHIGDIADIGEPAAWESETQGAETPTPRESEVHSDDAISIFPKPGSPANEVSEWWGQHLVERSRRFAVQREERAHRELLARLKQSLQSLPLEDAAENKNGLTLVACLYILIPCLQCGEVRQAVADYPEQTVVACPVCGLECEFITLGVGMTRKRVPFHELHNGISEDAEGKPRIPWDEMPHRKKNVEEDD